MAKTACTVPISQIILDEDIYPKSGVYPKRVSMFAENIRDGFKSDPIGSSRQAVDSYIADLRAATQMGMDIKIFRMNRLGVPQDRIAKRLGQAREVIRDHLAKMPVMANPPNSDLSRGFTVSQVAEKHGCNFRDILKL